ncbi:hypothetical protein [Holdemanella sp.]|uniref:hypothetical protein n=1 Tax=Holdemanella sp. TaxID=1971762 RepID=UPI003AEFEF6C
MLAFNENGKLTEYEETNFLKVCDSCHHIYKQRVEQQLEGMREREYDICPLCGEENDSSMQVDFYNSRLTEVELSKLRKKALIKTIIGYCDKQYKQIVLFVIIKMVVQENAKVTAKIVWRRYITQGDIQMERKITTVVECLIFTCVITRPNMLLNFCI